MNVFPFFKEASAAACQGAAQKIAISKEFYQYLFSSVARHFVKIPGRAINDVAPAPFSMLFSHDQYILCVFLI
jgi:hypothetical protein